MNVTPVYNVPGRQQGVALITVMLVVALATTAAVAMASRQQVDIRRTENTLYAGQAWMYMMGVEDWAKQFLAQDVKDNKIDHYGEDWATRLPPLPVEGGKVQGTLDDLQGRFNINSLAQSGDAGKSARQRFTRLLNVLGLNPDLANIAADWVDADQEPRFPAGAEDGFYLGQDPSYRSANRPMTSVSEMLLLKGMTYDDYEKLLPFITTLPVKTPININTASAQVLACLADDLPEKELEALVKKRADKPYNKVEDFLAERIFAGKKIPLDGLSVSSDYFMLQSAVDVGHVHRTQISLLERDNKGRVVTLQRSGAGL
jgi:general secretion pathway protein K